MLLSTLVSIHTGKNVIVKYEKIPLVSSVSHMLAYSFSKYLLALYCVLEKVTAPHSSALAWKIPWTEEPGGLQSMGSRRVGHDWSTSLSLFTFMHWRRKWPPTPVFLPGESQGGWWAAVYGVAQSRTRLKRLSSSSSSTSCWFSPYRLLCPCQPIDILLIYKSTTLPAFNSQVINPTPYDHFLGFFDLWSTLIASRVSPLTRF